MDNYQAELAAEKEHLAYIIAMAQRQLKALSENQSQQLAELVEGKREQWESSSHAIGNLWSGDSFYELVALSQNAQQLSEKISMLEREAQKILSLEKICQKPYFARLDFRKEGAQAYEKFYIGQASLLDEEEMRLHIYDWRSPLAGIFYRFGIGPAFYEAPQGQICGHVAVKRQYEIRRGQLEYFFEADRQIMDEFLRKLLAENSAPGLKTIVESIQREQDIIIRDLENDLMMVQGVAGSGKTSVALHRVAYLMYQGLQNKLAAHNIVIISPNQLFKGYIAGVLPQLGEENVISVTFEQILQDLLPQEQLQSKSQFLETLISASDAPAKNRLQEALGFKTSPSFKRVLEDFIEDIPNKWLEFCDVEYDGQIIIRADDARERILASKVEPLVVRLNRLETWIWNKIHELRPGRLQRLREQVADQGEHILEVEEYARLLSINESTALHEKIHGFTKLDIFGLYQALCKEYAFPLCPEKGRLPYEDALALAYLQLRLKGFYYDSRIKQVLIDEGQDYYPLHFEILRILFPGARYTVLADIQQTIAKPEHMGFFTSIGEILDCPRSVLLSLDKSFRCTREILQFSRQFLPSSTEIRGFNRSGRQPQIYKASCPEQLRELIMAEIKHCQRENYQSIGLLCKTAEQARELYESLQGQTELRLISNDSQMDISGTLILPIYMAKGLEFDAVLICGVDQDHYADDYDRNLLYIAATRPLHSLSLFYCGNISKLIQEKGGLENDNN